MARQLIAQISAAALFLQEWFQRPEQIGSVVPSSKNLSSAMAAWLPVNPDEFVLELGPGTGSVTHAILERGLRRDRLVAIEKSPKMADLLRKKYARTHIITGDAQELDGLLKEHVPQTESVGAVISSLPLRIFKPDAADAIVNKIYSVLRPGGTWVQYSYYLGTEQHKSASFFQLQSSEVVWLNFPPARINVYRKPAVVGK